MTSLHDNIEFFRKNKNTIIDGRNSGFVLIHNKKVDYFDSKMDALKEGFRRFGTAEFLVHSLKEEHQVNHFNRDLCLV